MKNFWVSWDDVACPRHLESYPSVTPVCLPNPVLGCLNLFACLMGFWGSYNKKRVLVRVHCLDSFKAPARLVQLALRTTA